MKKRYVLLVALLLSVLIVGCGLVETKYEFPVEEYVVSTEGAFVKFYIDGQPCSKHIADEDIFLSNEGTHVVGYAYTKHGEIKSGGYWLYLYLQTDEYEQYQNEHKKMIEVMEGSNAES